MSDYIYFLEKCKQELAQKQGSRLVLVNSLKRKRQQKRKLKSSIIAIERAREIVQEVAEETQKELEYRIGNLATLAIRSVFDDRYTCYIKFVRRRGKREADIIIDKDGIIMDDVLEETGGGVADLTSLALKIACWSIQKNRPLFILDEPFRNVSEDKQERCFQFLKELSSELGIQFIIVTHLPKMIYICDKEIHLIEGKDTINLLLRRK